jgi:hypothetical protein
MNMALITGDNQQIRLATLIETAESHYAFATPAYLNSAFPDVQPILFRDWFTSKLNSNLKYRALSYPDADNG